MADTQRRRLLDRLGTTPTVLAEGSQVIGDLIIPGGLVVSGLVRGDGQVGAALQVARGATWEGRVMAQCAVVAGTLVGELLVADKLEIGANAVIRGRVTARTVAIARGAQLDGELNVTSGEPVVQFEEKRGS
jgi:cytoskeletal protein CcmA (bactofilin family)